MTDKLTTIAGRPMAEISKDEMEVALTIIVGELCNNNNFPTADVNHIMMRVTDALNPPGEPMRWRDLKTDPPTGDRPVLLYPCISDVGIAYNASNPEFARQNGLRHGYRLWAEIAPAPGDG